ncbi:hypothetical protein D3C76_1344080 [compost metagenome]
MTMLLSLFFDLAYEPSAVQTAEIGTSIIPFVDHFIDFFRGQKHVAANRSLRSLQQLLENVNVVVMELPQ